MKLSMVMPGIRTEGWLRAYESIEKSLQDEFEFIIVSPYDLPENIKDKSNVRLIKDFGCPTRCMQRGIEEAKGEYFCWCCDDGVYVEGQLKKAMEIAATDVVIPMMYTESKNPSQEMFHPDYYKMWHHDMLRIANIPIDSAILGFAIFPTKLLRSVGGLNCQYESLAMAFADLSARLSILKIKSQLFCEICGKFDHMPGDSGDHGPVHYSQIDHDEPLLKHIYSTDEYLKQIIIPLDNWKNVPDVWNRRFNKENNNGKL